MAVTPTYPGVYIEELPSGGSAIIPVETALPVFIGYTERAERDANTGGDLPRIITSMADYERNFGGAPPLTFLLSTAAPVLHDAAYPQGEHRATASLQAAGKDYWITRLGTSYLMHSALRLFFANGGVRCYVVSVGSYDDVIDGTMLAGALTSLEDMSEPTLVIIPEAIQLAQADCSRLQQHCLKHCAKVQNRFAILDIWQGWRGRNDVAGDMVKVFRDSVGHENLTWGAAYYPWLETTLHSPSEFSFDCLDSASKTLLQQLLQAESASLPLSLATEIAAIGDDWTGKDVAKAALDQNLRSKSNLYREISEHIARAANRLPPASAIAGLYCYIDNQQGVWRAPANQTLADVAAPSVNVTSEDQDELTVSETGISVNAIRTFSGRGTLVWGARTLATTDPDVRYLNVRRTLIMFEQSLSQGLLQFKTEPNTGKTWADIRLAFSNFLEDAWKQGCLQGRTREEAFFHLCGPPSIDDYG